MKLELGAGKNPKKGDGWRHQDIRLLPNIDWVFDARKIPYEDKLIQEIFADNVIEHFGWREVKDVLKEWVRVLTVGGKLEIITPDFYNLWKNYITFRNLPKSDKWRGGPVDIGFVAYVTGGGQDYPENTHLAHYTADWYKNALEDLGCKVEISHHGKDHPSPMIRIVAIKKHS